MTFSGDTPPDLTFTRILSVKSDGAFLNKSSLYWNTLMYDVVARAANKLKSPEKLKQLILVNYVDGEGDAKSGYRFIPPAGLSVQGQDANAAWKTIFHLVERARFHDRRVVHVGEQRQSPSPRQARANDP